MWQPEALQNWCEALGRGEAVAAPAEGVYGLCADPFNTAALDQLLQQKQRDGAQKSFIVLAPEGTDFTALLGEFPATHHALCQTYWPCPQDAPITICLPFTENSPLFSAQAYFSPLNSQAPSFALRVPATPYMAAYLQAWQAYAAEHLDSPCPGVLVSTSLNISGQPAAKNLAEIPEHWRQNGLFLETDWQGDAAQLSGTPSRIYSTLENRWIR